MGWDDFIHNLVQHLLKVKFFKLIQNSVQYWAIVLPDVIILLVNILQRSNWRAPEVKNVAIEKKHKLVNQFGHKLMRVHLNEKLNAI